MSDTLRDRTTVLRERMSNLDARLNSTAHLLDSTIHGERPEEASPTSAVPGGDSVMGDLDGILGFLDGIERTATRLGKLADSIQRSGKSEGGLKSVRAW